MSVRLMGTIWYSTLETLPKVLLLALADHADDEGYNCRPSVERLEIKTGLARRTVQKYLSEFREAGILTIVAKATRYSPTDYRINVDRVPMQEEQGRAQRAPDSRGAADDTPGASRGAAEGSPGARSCRAQTIIEPLSKDSTKNVESFETSVSDDTDAQQYLPCDDDGNIIAPKKAFKPKTAGLDELREHIFAEYQRVNGRACPRTKMFWGQLKHALKAFPWPLDDLKRAVSNRFKSTGVNHSDDPAKWLSYLGEYLHAPKKKREPRKSGNADTIAEVGRRLGITPVGTVQQDPQSVPDDEEIDF